MKFGYISLVVGLGLPGVALAQITLNVKEPLSGNTYTSPVMISASAKSLNGPSGWTVYLDDQLAFQNTSTTGTLSTTIPAMPGNHTVVIKAWDNSGAAQPATENITVSSGPPVLNVGTYGATGSANTATCTTTAGSNALTNCAANVYDFAVGQVIRLVGAGPAIGAAQGWALPLDAHLHVYSHIDPKNTDTSHRYCYALAVANPLQGILVTDAAPACNVTNSDGTIGDPLTGPDLSLNSYFSLAADTAPFQPFGSAVFLWYVSKDGQPYKLVRSKTGVGFANVDDHGQSFSTPKPELPGAAASLASRGGWPNDIPVDQFASIAKSQDLFTTITGLNGNQAFVQDAPSTSLTSATVFHDDTQAVQRAIEAAATSPNGGTVQFGNGTYYIEQPFFRTTLALADAPAQVPFTRRYTADPTTGYKGDPSNGGFSQLAMPDAAKGVHLEGQGAGTVLITLPDEGFYANLIAIGAYTRPEYSGKPVIPIATVNKGDTIVTLAGSASSSGLNPGDDIYLFSGSFGGGTCAISAGCQYSELNTIASVNGNSVTLLYPASKKYYQDPHGNPFGIIQLPPTPHDIALEHMSINTYNPMTGTGQSYGLTMNDLHINGYVTNGPFGGGYRRGVLIENSVWGTGTGDTKFPNYGVVDEYDKFTNVSFLNNSIYGFSTAGAEGPSLQAQIRATEGSSQFTFKNNTLYDLSVYFDQTSDDIVTGNTFNNSLLELGVSFSDSFYRDSYISYGPTTSLNPSTPSVDVENNTFLIDATFIPPYIINVGDYASAVIAGNSITYTGSNVTQPILVYSGSVTKNILNFSVPLFNAAIVLIPEEAPGGQPSVLSAENNVINAPELYTGVYIPGSNITESITVCGNTYTAGNGGQTKFDAGVNVVNNSAPNVSVALSCQ